MLLGGAVIGHSPQAGWNRAAGKRGNVRFIKEPGTSISICLTFRTLSYFSAFNAPTAHYVEYDLIDSHEVVGDYATMALPPDRFGAHYCSSALMADFVLHGRHNPA